MSGIFLDGNSVTLTGTSFGTKTAAPLMWDTFEDGTVNTNLASNVAGSKNWSINVDNNPNPSNNGPQYNTAQVYNGSQSAFADIQDGGNCSSGLSTLATEKIFTSFYFRWNLVSGSTSGTTTKGFRVNADDGPNVYTSYPQSVVQDFQDDSRMTISPNDSANGATRHFPGSIAQDTWFKLEYYLEMGDPGIYQHSEDLVVQIDRTPVTRTTGVTDKWERLHMPFFAGNGITTEYWYDDVYIDITRARVEVGDASTYAACTLREIQPATAWSDTSVTVTVNEGRVTTEGSQFLYAIDDNGDVSDGFPIVAAEVAGLAPTVVIGFIS